jgi:hypothetical protein
MIINNGGPAFPTPDPSDNWGMTLRDWFAGQALAGWLASFAGMSVSMKPENMALEAYQFADAMLAERVKE